MTPVSEWGDVAYAGCTSGDLQNHGDGQAASEAGHRIMIAALCMHYVILYNMHYACIMRNIRVAYAMAYATIAYATQRARHQRSAPCIGMMVVMHADGGADGGDKDVDAGPTQERYVTIGLGTQVSVPDCMAGLDDEEVRKRLSAEHCDEHTFAGYYPDEDYDDWRTGEEDGAAPGGGSSPAAAEATPFTSSEELGDVWHGLVGFGFLSEAQVEEALKKHPTFMARVVATMGPGVESIFFGAAREKIVAAAKRLTAAEKEAQVLHYGRSRRPGRWCTVGM